MTRVLHLSRQEAEQYTPAIDGICISITDPGAPDARLSDQWRAIWRVSFHDLDALLPDLTGNPPPVLLNQLSADGIADFIVRHWPVPLIVAHCEAGISRSAGVVAALNDWMPEQLIVIQTGIPNRLVWRLVFEALVRRTITDPALPTE